MFLFLKPLFQVTNIEEREDGELFRRILTALFLATFLGSNKNQDKSFFQGQNESESFFDPENEELVMVCQALSR